MAKALSDAPYLEMNGGGPDTVPGSGSIPTRRLTTWTARHKLFLVPSIAIRDQSAKFTHDTRDLSGGPSQPASNSTPAFLHRRPGGSRLSGWSVDLRIGSPCRSRHGERGGLRTVLEATGKPTSIPGAPGSLCDTGQTGSAVRDGNVGHERPFWQDRWRRPDSLRAWIRYGSSRHSGGARSAGANTVEAVLEKSRQRGVLAQEQLPTGDRSLVVSSGRALRAIGNCHLTTLEGQK